MGTFVEAPSDRGQYYDRNPSIQTLDYEASGVGPHGSTIRVAYTVPTGREAFVELTYVRMFRESFASNVGNTEVQIAYTPSGGTAERLNARMARTNILYSEARHNTAKGFSAMLAGDIVSVMTSDSSTGGTNNYVGAVKLAEYDA